MKLSTGSEDGSLDYKPGDHIALYPANRPELVQALVDKLQDKPDDNDLVTVEMCREEKGAGSGKRDELLKTIMYAII